MSVKKSIAKLQKGQAFVQQGQQAAQMAQQTAGILGGLGSAGAQGASSSGSGQGLAERAASGQHAATKALQKASQMLGGGSGGSAPSGLQFTLTAGGLPPQTFVVTDFTLTEGFSQPFHLNV
ncbi:type VI secretion system tip protein VgrG, partial [Xenorhabdus sp. XENO-2]|nr:type VI secretion system tip protein VgrG [Xenorhabdus anantnagensis]